MPRTKELNKEERRGEEAFSNWKELTDNIEIIRQKTVKNAELFTKIYDNQWWKDILGNEDAQWTELLGQVEVFYSRAEVARWMMLYKRLAVEFGFALEDLVGIPVMRLENIAKYCDTSSQAEHYVDLAKTLSASDWKDEINKLRGKPTRDECKHANGFTKIEVCPTCGEKHKIN